MKTLYINTTNEQIQSNIETKPTLIKVVPKDFDRAIKKIKDSVMANQEGKKNNPEENDKDKTSIERILEMKDTYKFRNASK